MNEMSYLIFRSKPVIEFRNIENPAEVILTHSLAPTQIRNLCTVSPSTLLYIDLSKTPCEVNMLDCTGQKPRSLREQVVRVEHTGISVCYTESVGKAFLIIAGRDLCAYDLVSGKMSWKIAQSNSMNAKGVTSDGCGHLFVCNDKNMSLEMYSVSKGKYLGCLIKNGEQGLGELWRVTWCNPKSSLIGAYDTGSKWSIAAIHLEYE